MTSNPLNLGSRRELFLDHYLIEKLCGLSLKLHEPRPSGTVVSFDAPWEDAVCGYTTVLADDGTFRMYYRARLGRFTGYAESGDGITWTKPRLGLVEWEGSTTNNIVVEDVDTFAPFLDPRPEVAADERFKANAVERDSSGRGLAGYVSGDGIRWRRLCDEPIAVSTVENAFDSQNVMFWSGVEQCYLLYARHMEGGRRATMRAMSDDFRQWSEPIFMTYGDTGETTPSTHLYTNQTQPYFRAPHIYIALSARIFFADGKSISRDDDLVAAAERMATPEVREFYTRHLDRRLQNGPGDHSDVVLLTSRAGSSRYDSTFLESFIRPGMGLENWTTRNNYPVCGIVQTSASELSIYVHRRYGQKASYLERMTLRLDGFASVNAPYSGGRMVTRPLTFSGRQLEINCATSAAGSIRVEMQQPDGKPLEGYGTADCTEIVGDRIDHIVQWTTGADLSQLRDHPIRVAFDMVDADLYSLRFEP